MTLWLDRCRCKVLVTLCVLLAGCHTGRASPRPNVLLVVVDSWRADSLGLYNPEVTWTRNLDRFGRGGVVFSDFLAQSTSTRNSTPSILASLYPIEHGCNSQFARLSPRVVTMAEIFRDNGYRTFGASANPYVSRALGLAQGFEAFHGVQRGRKVRAELLHRRFAAWLAKEDRRPFFAMLWYMEPHLPYEAPGEVFAGGLAARRGPAEPAGGHAGTGDGGGDAEAARVGQRLYAREVAELDRAFGELLQILADRRSAWNTVILLTGDHGESFAEKRRIDGAPAWGHGTAMVEEQLRVPLIVRAPRGARGARISGYAEHVDLLPTLGELAGLRVDPEVRRQWRGRSLADLLRPGAEPTTGRSMALTQFFAGDDTWSEISLVEALYWNNLKMVVTYSDKTHRYVPPAVALFDLAQGEAELDTSAAEQGLVVARMQRMLESWEGAVATSPESLRATPELQGPRRDRLRRSLRALGYVD